MKPPTEPVLPFVDSRVRCRNRRRGKECAGFLGKAYDPYRLTQDPNKPIQLDDLTLRKEVPAGAHEGPVKLSRASTGRAGLEKALNDLPIDEYSARHSTWCCPARLATLLI